MNIDIPTLQQQIDALYLPNHTLSIEDYNLLIYHTTQHKEFAATVFVYDHMIANGVKPDPTTYKYINTLHSKTLPENKFIQLHITKRSLQPRRRIHKIMKGYLYKDQYQNALQYADKVKIYLTQHPDVSKTPNLIKLAKQISNTCYINMKDARYIITHLKRTRFFGAFNNQSKMTDFL